MIPDTDMTSDILIYNILKDSEDSFISNCNLKFIDKSVPAQEDNTIYIANVDLEYLQETFETVYYKALVNVFVKTKDTDYVEGSRFLRTVVKHIKYVLKQDEECLRRDITFRNVTYEYGSGYTLKGLHLLVQLREEESKDLEDEFFECVREDTDGLEIDIK